MENCERILLLEIHRLLLPNLVAADSTSYFISTFANSSFSNRPLISAFKLWRIFLISLPLKAITSCWIISSVEVTRRTHNALEMLPHFLLSCWKSGLLKCGLEKNPAALGSNSNQAIATNTAVFLHHILYDLPRCDWFVPPTAENGSERDTIWRRRTCLTCNDSSKLWRLVACQGWKCWQGSFSGLVLYGVRLRLSIKP